jgi:hypothetical protein
MIRDVVLHIANDQPLLCDVEALPKPSDAAVVCTNLRLVDGKKPVFIDHGDSWFVFPMGVIRFLEIPRGAFAASGGSDAGEVPALTAGGRSDGDLSTEADEPDEDLLRRVRDV